MPRGLPSSQSIVFFSFPKAQRPAHVRGRTVALRASRFAGLVGECASDTDYTNLFDDDFLDYLDGLHPGPGYGGWTSDEGYPDYDDGDDDEELAAPGGMRAAAPARHRWVFCQVAGNGQG